MPAPHALYSKMLAERTASRNVLVYFILIISHTQDSAMRQLERALLKLLSFLLKVAPGRLDSRGLHGCALDLQ
jgi:hypothetical protein